MSLSGKWSLSVISSVSLKSGRKKVLSIGSYQTSVVTESLEQG